MSKLINRTRQTDWLTSAGKRVAKLRRTFHLRINAHWNRPVIRRNPVEQCWPNDLYLQPLSLCFVSTAYKIITPLELLTGKLAVRSVISWWTLTSIAGYFVDTFCAIATWIRNTIVYVLVTTNTFRQSMSIKYTSFVPSMQRSSTKH